MIGDPTRIPVIVEMGRINDRPAQEEPGLDPAGLMVPQISFPGLDLPPALARETGQ